MHAAPHRPARCRFNERRNEEQGHCEGARTNGAHEALVDEGLQRAPAVAPAARQLRALRLAAQPRRAGRVVQQEQVDLQNTITSEPKHAYFRGHRALTHSTANWHGRWRHPIPSRAVVIMCSLRPASSETGMREGEVHLLDCQGCQRLGELYHRAVVPMMPAQHVHTCKSDQAVQK